MTKIRASLVTIAALFVPASAVAQPASEPAGPPPPPAAAPTSGPKIVPLGYVETHFSWNFNRPANGITNYRGFDNRHATFTLDNVALGANAEAGPVAARLILQVGATPSTYYAGEPSLAGSSGANATSGELWKFVQEANFSLHATSALTVQGGLFPSPIGYEVLAVKDNWNWSRSNLFFALPYYHAGVRVTYELTAEIAWTAGVYNGWNDIVDGNEGKTVMTHLTYKVPDKVLVQALYCGGPERPTGAPEGPWFRHHFDLFGQIDVTSFLAFVAQLDYGFEPDRIGTARWWGGALYVRAKPVDRLYVALRGDFFHEDLATDSAGDRSSTPLFFNGVEWVSSPTATLDFRPHERISLRLEGRHDMAASPLYFGHDVKGTGAPADPYVPDRRTQTTLLAGATAWF